MLGIKIFQVCESKTGYAYKFLVYQGNMASTFNIENQMENVRGATNTNNLTVGMIEPLLDQGYHLYVDNWYTSFKYVDEHETPACETLRKK